VGAVRGAVEVDGAGGGGAGVGRWVGRRIGVTIQDEGRFLRLRFEVPKCAFCVLESRENASLIYGNPSK